MSTTAAMNTTHALSLLPPLLALGVPLVFAAGSLAAATRPPLRAASTAATAALAVALSACLLGLLSGVGIASAPDAAGLAQSFPWAARLAAGVTLDPVTGTMLLLVCTVGACIARYSLSYLDRAAGVERYASSFLATLACVTVLVTADHLLVVAAAWMGTSLALHQLLTFHPERRPALIAAHKKFLLSRLADACIAGALLLLWNSAGSLDIEQLHAWAQASGHLPPAGQAAALLLVMAVALKSAQLPFHGWLTQVMEAPTPVSALLHAGVVNIGGFLLIRLAPLLAAAPAAQVLLATIATVTTVVAALVMTTRVSVKVALAWSTCAQMGMMLVQCALGAWPMALLHLVGHSLYKAHSFLGTGSRVEEWKASALRSAGKAPAPRSATLACAFVVAALYAGWHAVAESVPGLPTAHAASPIAQAIVGAGFVTLVLVQSLLKARPTGALATFLRPRLFAGFWLDEVFKRMTFVLWPPALPPREARGLALPVEDIVEA